jgi:hypothetical protein
VLVCSRPVDTRTEPGIKERIVDLYNKPEILFFGPEGMPIRFSNILGVYKPILQRGRQT